MNEIVFRKEEDEERTSEMIRNNTKEKNVSNVYVTTDNIST